MPFHYLDIFGLSFEAEHVRIEHPSGQSVPSRCESEIAGNLDLAGLAVDFSFQFGLLAELAVCFLAETDSMIFLFNQKLNTYTLR